MTLYEIYIEALKDKRNRMPLTAFTKGEARLFVDGKEFVLPNNSYVRVETENDIVEPDQKCSGCNGRGWAGKAELVCERCYGRGRT